MTRIGHSVGMIASVVLVAIFSGATTRAQSPTGRIVGNVTDPSGAPIPGAKVTIRNVATKDTESATTGNDGFYQVLALPIGSYEVKIDKEGFQERVFENQALQINQSLRVDGLMVIGSQTQTVRLRRKPPPSKPKIPPWGARWEVRPYKRLPSMAGMPSILPSFSPASRNPIPAINRPARTASRAAVRTA